MLKKLLLILYLSAMKVQCDVCDKAAASLICIADEAALCTDCDTRIHAANKLASKHQRLPLFATPSEPPRCDICQEKTAYFFCLEDRALLCRECDVSIHNANALAANHQRFLVTGVRVALHAVNAQEPALEQTVPSSTARKPAAINGKAVTLAKASTKVGAKLKPTPSTANVNLPPPVAARTSVPTFLHSQASSKRKFHDVPALNGPHVKSQTPSGLAYKNGSISEFLTEGIPGWRWDELLTMSDLAGAFDFGEPASSKADVPSFGDHDYWTNELKLLEEHINTECPAAVPQMPSPPTASGLSRGKSNLAIKSKLKWSPMAGVDFEEDVSIVPDIGLRSSPTAYPPPKRSRPFTEL